MVVAETGKLDWLMQDLVTRLPGVRHAVVLSTDGLLAGRSRDMSKDDAEHFSAMASAFQSLARGAGQRFDGGRVRQTVVEMDRAFLFVTAAGQGACLALLAADGAKMGMVAYEMTMMVKKVGAYLTSAPRQEPPDLRVDPQMS